MDRPGIFPAAPVAKLHITSDGTPAGTHCFAVVAENGQAVYYKLDGVDQIVWTDTRDRFSRPAVVFGECTTTFAENPTKGKERAPSGWKPESNKRQKPPPKRTTGSPTRMTIDPDLLKLKKSA